MRESGAPQGWVSTRGLWPDTIASNPGNLEKGKKDEKADADIYSGPSECGLKGTDVC